jgi:signal transduction histidine kinase
VTLRTRLVLGILAIAMLLVVPLFVARRSLDSFDRTMSELQREEFAASLLLGRMRSEVNDLRTAELSLFARVDSTSLHNVFSGYDKADATASALLAVGGDASPHRLRSTLRRVPLLAQAEFTARVRDDTLTGDAISDTMRVVLRGVDDQIQSAEVALRERLQDRVEKAREQSVDAGDVTMLAFAMAALLAALVGGWLVRSISDPVRDLERGMDAVANGEFSYRLRLKADRDDEFGRLATSYHAMSAQLAELDKLKAEFVSVASHELKTPINVIGGYLSLLDEGVYGPLTARQREVCATISAQCDALARLARQLLDVSRFEAGGGKIEPSRFQLRHFLEELDRSFQVLAMQRDVHLRITRGVGLPEEVTWDADRINEVLGNLLSNAFKFTPRGGRVELMAEADGNRVQLTVRDSGAGIPPAQLPHIFKKFYQADNQGSASAKGTGLGLAISKGIVDAHGGSVAVDSEIGVGTTFTIVLPTHTRPPRRVTPPRRIAALVGA